VIELRHSPTDGRFEIDTLDALGRRRTLSLKRDELLSLESVVMNTMYIVRLRDKKPGWLLLNTVPERVVAPITPVLESLPDQFLIEQQKNLESVMQRLRQHRESEAAAASVSEAKEKESRT